MGYLKYYYNPDTWWDSRIFRRSQLLISDPTAAAGMAGGGGIPGIPWDPSSKQIKLRSMNPPHPDYALCIQSHGVVP